MERIVASERLPLIRLDTVSKRFATVRDRPDFLAVDRVSLTIGAGERFGIIGSSGAGKSTLLRLINLLERPDDGRVHIADRELTRLSRRDLRVARSGIGMIFQQFNLLQNATVFDNVAFPLTIQRPRLSRADRRLRVDECLKIVGLSSKVDSYPAQLSGGQKQRVAIARALATRPAVMLCDEPTSALDSETTRSVLDVLGDINARLGVTLVVVTHELAVTRRLCERVAVMAEGRIVEDIVLDGSGDRLETAIGRANRPDDAEAERAPISFERATRPEGGRLRVGGLPLPAKRVGPAVDRPVDRHAALRERIVASWLPRDGAATAAHPPVALRAGGLPLPRKTKARAVEPAPRAFMPRRPAVQERAPVDFDFSGALHV